LFGEASNASTSDDNEQDNDVPDFHENDETDEESRNISNHYHLIKQKVA
jgi:hypothetical protein